MKRIKKFILLPWEYKVISVEALIITAVARFIILVVPFRYLAGKIGKPMTETPYQMDSAKLIKGTQIAGIINTIAKVTPWKSNCLVKALSCQFMLRRRKIPSTLYLGVAKEKNGEILAHAWLRCGNRILTGKETSAMFKPIACFGYSIGVGENEG